MEIDLVYLWVDGGDPAWQAKRRACAGDSRASGEGGSKARYANHDELKYALRSAEKYAPWIRRIFIVTDAQTPAWLDTANPRVRIVDQSQILPPEALPCFNSTVIESYLHRIPGLAEHFLYANDDMFFTAPLAPNFFFAPDGWPFVRLKRKPLGKWHYRAKVAGKALLGKRPGSYRATIHRAAELVERKYGTYYAALPHHNVDAYRKSDLAEVFEGVFREQTEAALPHHFRTDDDLQRAVALYYALAVGHGHLKYADNRESLRIVVQRADFDRRFLRFRPALLCLNDSQHAGDDDRQRIRPFLEALFPEKSAFEK